MPPKKRTESSSSLRPEPTMDRFLRGQGPAASTPAAKMAPAAGHKAPPWSPVDLRSGAGSSTVDAAEVGEHTLPPPSPLSDLSPGLPHSLNHYQSSDSEDGTRGAYRDTDSSPLPCAPAPQPCSAPHGPHSVQEGAMDVPQPPDVLAPGERALWTLIRSLPSRADFDLFADRVESALKRDLTVMQQQVSDMELRVTSLEREGVEVRHRMTELERIPTITQSSISQLSLLIDDLENRSRRQNIRIKGLPESIVTADLRLRVTELFNTYLERPTHTEIAIDRVHRTLGPRNPEELNPRDVLCRLHSYTVKESILQRAWRKGPMEFAGAEIHLYPDVSRKTLQMRRTLKPLLDSLRSHGITYKWGHPFHLIVRKGSGFFALRQHSDLPALFDFLAIPPLPLQDWLAPPTNIADEPLQAARPRRNRGPRRPSLPAPHQRQPGPAP